MNFQFSGRRAPSGASKYKFPSRSTRNCRKSRPKAKLIRSSSLRTWSWVSLASLSECSKRTLTIDRYFDPIGSLSDHLLFYNSSDGHLPGSQKVIPKLFSCSIVHLIDVEIYLSLIRYNPSIHIIG